MLTVSLGKQLRDFILDVRFSVNDDEILVLFGENGAGKTTILSLIAGLLTPDYGKITLSSRTLFNSDTNLSVPVEERNVGYVFQQYALFPHMTVRENLSYGLSFRGEDQERIGELVETWLKRCELTHIADERVPSLSGGQQQRVALARVLIKSPDLILLDEPLAALDIKTKEVMRGEIKRTLKISGKPAILVTHSFRDAEQIGDRYLLIERGRITADGDVRELKGHCVLSN